MFCFYSCCTIIGWQTTNIPVLYHPAGHSLTGDKVRGLQCLICKGIMLPIAFHFVHVLRLLQVYAELDQVVPSLAMCIVIPVPHNLVNLWLLCTLAV